MKPKQISDKNEQHEAEQPELDWAEVLMISCFGFYLQEEEKTTPADYQEYARKEQKDCD